ncbi:hypothetical protein BX666DRAFT_1874706 [Dichotomocladium elegans]|nr:hypothetical protein BX666DRAFT_1874706 [Dichotomocladium elegans]
MDDYDVKQHLELVSPWSTDPTAFLARYYTLHYYVNPTQSNHTLYVRQAPNKVCILGVAHDHAALLQHQDLAIEFQPKLSAGDNVKPDTVLCELVLGETRYEVRAHMRGKILEFNPRLTSALLREKPMTEGYLAVILPFHEDSAIQLNEYIGEQAYKEKQLPAKTATIGSEADSEKIVDKEPIHDAQIS